MSQPIIVPSLRVEAASGPTFYPSENGFSAVWGEVLADTPELGSQLNQAVASGESVLVRCGMLEATGTLELLAASGTDQRYKLHVQAVHLGSTAHVA